MNDFVLFNYLEHRGRMKVASSCQPLRHAQFAHSPLIISETVRDRCLLPKDHQKDMAYGLSNCHVTYDITWS